VVADNAQAFEQLADELDYPLFIVTAAAGEELAGCLVGFATQASIDPPRFLACISKANRTYHVARAAQALVVHAVPADAEDLAELFGGQTGDDVDKFARCEWRPGPGGAPVLARCPSWFGGPVLERIDLGDHVGFLVEPSAGEHAGLSGVLGFQRARRIDPGHDA
jgi:flavin reductase (DIM6/NTAB) family NADH-FMN oxidoreductase RutF